MVFFLMLHNLSASFSISLQNSIRTIQQQLSLISDNQLLQNEQRGLHLMEKFSRTVLQTYRAK